MAVVPGGDGVERVECVAGVVAAECVAGVVAAECVAGVVTIECSVALTRLTIAIPVLACYDICEFWRADNACC